MNTEFHMCPKYERLSAFLGKRWTTLILRVLLEGEFRFSEIMETVPGLSSRLLTERLKEMEEMGLVLREVRNEYPIKVEYTLTEKGKDLEPIIKEMQSYADQWIELESMTNEMRKLNEYLKILDERNQTCIILSGTDIIYESDSLGVKPLRMLRESNFKKQEDHHLILIDKVIGKGALMLASLLGVDEVYTPLASETALNYSKKTGTPLHYETLVPFIENRDRTAMCPIEYSVKDTDDPNQGEQNINAAIKLLMHA